MHVHKPNDANQPWNVSLSIYRPHSYRSASYKAITSSQYRNNIRCMSVVFDQCTTLFSKPKDKFGCFWCLDWHWAVIRDSALWTPRPTTLDPPLISIHNTWITQRTSSALRLEMLPRLRPGYLTTYGRVHDVGVLWCTMIKHQWSYVADVIFRINTSQSWWQKVNCFVHPNTARTTKVA